MTVWRPLLDLDPCLTWSCLARFWEMLLSGRQLNGDYPKVGSRVTTCIWWEGRWFHRNIKLSTLKYKLFPFCLWCLSQTNSVKVCYCFMVCYCVLSVLVWWGIGIVDSEKHSVPLSKTKYVQCRRARHTGADCEDESWTRIPTVRHSAPPRTLSSWGGQNEIMHRSCCISFRVHL